MNIYLIELAVFIVIMCVLGVISKVKKIEKVKIIFAIFAGLFGIIVVSTYLLEQPTLAVSSNALNVEVNENMTVPTIFYHAHDVSGKVEVKGAVDYNTVGSYNVKFVVPTIFGQHIIEKEINVVDTTAPVITLNGEKELKLSYTAEYAEEGCTVEDNSGELLTDKIQIEKEEISDKEYNIIYTVEDNYGNIGKEVRHVTIIDDILPEIDLKGSNHINIEQGKQYVEQGATATDEIDGDLSDKIVITGEVDTSKPGTYTISYNVFDNSGNQAFASRKVVVYNEDSLPEDGKGIVYLTFDDGPSESITPKVLDVLKEKNVKATFFILNYTAGTQENLVKRAFEEGHTIAIHGYSHDYSYIYKSVDIYMSNITRLQEKIKNTTGYNATITRFPGGSSNTISKFNPGIMSKLVKEVVNRGYKYFDWNVSSGDAGGAKNSTDVYNNVTKSLKKDRSNVVLMHDYSGNTKTLNALADIIDYCKNNGYILARITEDTPMVTHGVAN